MNTTLSLIKKADAGGLPLLIARILLGGTFIYMGVHKVLDPVEFLKLIRQYEMVPESPPYFLNGMAVVFPWLEIVSGTALLLGMYVRGSVAMMAVMLCVFTPVIFIRAMHIHATEGIPFTQVEFDCGCGAGVVVIWTRSRAVALARRPPAARQSYREPVFVALRAQQDRHVGRA